MKKMLVTMAGILMLLPLAAGNGWDIPDPPVTQVLVNDRFRNTPAVDPDLSGTSRRFYMTSFGLENFDRNNVQQTQEEQAPLPKHAVLVRFGIENISPDNPMENWHFVGTQIYSMNDVVFNEPETTPINCYNDEDYVIMSGTYPSQLRFTDNSYHTEAYMRYGSGTGCWASPVFYQTQFGKKLILLNKSGCLICVDVSNEIISVDWKIDLRIPERNQYPGSASYEFMATPVIVDGKIYVPGIRMLHVIDTFLQPPSLTSYTCDGMTVGDDYFDKPVIFDTQQTADRKFYFISHLGNPYIFNGFIVTRLTTTPLGRSDSQPVIDADGHIYFYTEHENGIKISYVDQEIRDPENNIPPIVSTSINNQSFIDPVTSSVLTDFTQTQYLFTQRHLIRIKEPYNYISVPPPNDPVSYDNPFSDYNQTELMTNDGKRFPSNHAILSYHNSTNQSMIFSINNSNSNQYQSDIINCYPNSTNLYNIRNCAVNLSYVSYNYSYEDSLHSFSCRSESIPELQSWGGIAPYHSSIPGYLNALFGDECGSITTYNLCLASASVAYNPIFEEGEDAIPQMGYTKFMKNLNNFPSNDEVNEVNVYIRNYLPSIDSYTYINGYVSPNLQSVIPESSYPASQATFTNLLPNKRYSIAWKNAANMLQVFDNIEISENNCCIILDENADWEIPDIPNTDPDVETNYPYDDTLIINRVTVHDLAHWRIGNGSKIHVNVLTIEDGAKITIGDGALLTVNRFICNSPNNVAQIDVDGEHTGRLNVAIALNNLISSKLRISGYNLQNRSYFMACVNNNEGAYLEFASCSNAQYRDNISASIASLTNYGDVLINDCVEITGNYIDFDDNPPISGVLKINDDALFGHLIWKNSIGCIRSELFVGYHGMMPPENAKLTIQGNGVCKFTRHTSLPRSVYGTLVINGTSKCVVDGLAVLKFESDSKLILNGDLQASHGAELRVCKLLPDGNAGIVIFAEGVSIVGNKPNPNPSNPMHFGDRIITDEYGRIEGDNQDHPRWLYNVSISSGNPADSRWDGIYVYTSSYNDHSFGIISSDHSTISGIDRILIEHPGYAPIYEGIKFVNCTYGIYSTTSVPLDSTRAVNVINCKFENCGYGIYLEDCSFQTPTFYPLKIYAKIDSCRFGNVDMQTGNNSVGIAARACADVCVTNSQFYRNSYGIFSLKTNLIIGRTYSEDGNLSDGPCQFYNNIKAGVYAAHFSSTELRSLIYNNTFSGEYSSGANLSGIGVWIHDSNVDIIENSLSNLTGHGALLTSYSWLPWESEGDEDDDNFYGFRENIFDNNEGCELIGDAASLSSSKDGNNIFDDTDYDETWYIPTDPMNDTRSWDKYLLANLSDVGLTRPADVRGNTFIQNPYNNRDRFYSSFLAFRFDLNTNTQLEDMILTGMTQFYQGQLAASIQSMKQAVESYPDSTQTKLAIDYLYLATRASTEDYAGLRAYLDLNIPSETLATYVKKEEIKTKCFIKEDEYLTAIGRLQHVIDNSEAPSDSLFALIDQAYCYLNLASSGAKALPDVSAKTPDFTSYVDFLAGLSTKTNTMSQLTHPVSPTLRIDSNFPNPFNPDTSIRFSVPKAGRVTLTIYNIKGQKVKQLLNEYIEAGKHSIVWNGKDSRDRTVSSGIYFAKIEQGTKHQVHKMMLIK